MFISLSTHRFHSHRKTIFPGGNIRKANHHHRCDRPTNYTRPTFIVQTNQNTGNISGCNPLPKNTIRSVTKESPEPDSRLSPKLLLFPCRLAFLLQHFPKRSRLSISSEPTNAEPTTNTSRTNGLTDSQPHAIHQAPRTSPGIWTKTSRRAGIRIPGDSPRSRQDHITPSTSPHKGPTSRLTYNCFGQIPIHGRGRLRYHGRTNQKNSAPGRNLATDSTRILGIHQWIIKNCRSKNPTTRTTGRPIHHGRRLEIYPYYKKRDEIHKLLPTISSDADDI